MRRPDVLIVWIVALSALPIALPRWAHAQLSVDEAMTRLRERKAAREGESTTQPASTRPTTRPSTTPASTRPAIAVRPAATRPTTLRPATTGASTRPSAPATFARAPRPTGDAPPPAPREFRAAWVASVQNAQWPSAPGLTVEQQRREMLDILHRCAALRLNAIILQVRPCADALYPSELEPWSEYLTGTQGQAPDPMWDPLQTWIEECHKRGMELHAWFNPYRVKHAGSKSPHIDAKSIAKTHPKVVRQYGKYLWMDPGEPLAAKQTLDVIAEIVKRYDVDGVHTDDYYYYYPYQARDEQRTSSTSPMPTATSATETLAALSSATIGGGTTSTASSSRSTRPPTRSSRG